MAGVQKRTRNGTVRWIARWRDGNGQPHSKTFDRRAAALEHGNRQERAERTRPDLAQLRRTLTVGDWLDRWLDNHVAPRVVAGQLRPRTAEGYESSVRVHLQPALGDVLLADLRAGDVNRFVTTKLATHAPASVKQYRAALSAAITDAEAAELVDRHAVRSSRAVPDTSTAGDISVFTPDELARIVDACQHHRLGPAVLFGAATGLRRSELIALHWADIDHDAGEIRVRRGRHRVSAAASRVVEPGMHETDTKNSSSNRTLQLDGHLAGLLRGHRAAQATAQLSAPMWIGCPHVFTSTVGTPLEGRQLARALDQVLTDADVDRGGAQVTHELRRTWATLLAEDGIDPEVLMKLGGWESMDVPSKVYVAVSKDRLRQGTAAATNRILGS